MPHTAPRCQARQCRRSGTSLEARASHVHGPGAAACIYQLETCHLAEVRSEAAGHLPGRGTKLGHAPNLKPALNPRESLVPKHSMPYRILRTHWKV